MKTYLLALALFGLHSTTFCQRSDESSIRNLLAGQVDAWNHGQIDRFMEGYWPDDSLVFIGKNGPTYGYAKTLENYKKSYPDRAHMGQLEFTLLKLDRLSNEYYFVIGKWNLARTVGDVGGTFTLLFRKIGGQWKIVADHSS